ncbi:3-phenylpropionate/cinnamic acid dioxygenase, small subunit [Amycolatopsis marina]|uniref:3-phenylpropionate/cinnamic acid dioxygenase, small subunit n=1 Tax=Amycolatopsis marina TaxID=490629 RepID=A0A1I1BV63_9PSEU|nr:aromatic-ring-hydroxylating dioxygenase subunit beta [Amycolatopsis marina]SFB53586.1 3-phenylpropionate/cinnamic acid dioxygenase, small subunit [Amycolatopsis marina]
MTTATEITDIKVREATEWLFTEAELLDAGKYREWLDLVAEDLSYVVPLRVTREREAETDIVEGMTLMDDDWDSMEMRVLRLETEYAWAEDPPSRSRHFVTNIRVAAGEAEDEVAVKSNLLLYRTRGDVATFDILSGERHDVLRRVAGGYRLVKRVVVLDQTTVMTHNLALIM